MATKIRKQIYIEPAQEILLKQVTTQTGVSEAELIRQAIDQHVKLMRPPKPALEVWAAERAFITHLIQLGPVSTPAKRTWRREDLYDR